MASQSCACVYVCVYMYTIYTYIHTYIYIYVAVTQLIKVLRTLHTYTGDPLSSPGRGAVVDGGGDTDHAEGATSYAERFARFCRACVGLGLRIYDLAMFVVARPQPYALNRHTAIVFVESSVWVWGAHGKASGVHQPQTTAMSPDPTKAL